MKNTPEAQKSYYEKNKEKIIATAKQWRLDNPEKYKAMQKKYKQANKDKVREQNKKDTAKFRANNPDYYELNWIKRKWEKYLKSKAA